MSVELLVRGWWSSGSCSFASRLRGLRIGHRGAIPADGTGLPPGSGNAAEGAQIYADRCAGCHGDAGQGTAQGPQLLAWILAQHGIIGDKTAWMRNPFRKS